MSQPIILHYPASFSTTWLQHCIHSHTDKRGGGWKRSPPIHVAGRHPPFPTKHANLWLICWLVFYDKHTDRGGTSVDWVLLSWQRPGFKPICCTNNQSEQWPFPRKATTRTVHCLKQGACLQSDITIAAAPAAAGSFSCSSPETTSSHSFLVLICTDTTV